MNRDDEIWYKILDRLKCKIISYSPTNEELKQMLLDVKYSVEHGLMQGTRPLSESTSALNESEDIFVSPEAMNDIKNWGKNE